MDDLLSRRCRQIQSVSVKIDSKGRISIPGYVRRNFGLEEGSEIVLSFNLKRNFIILTFGQDGVARSIEARGASGPGAIPGSDPVKKMGVEK